MRRSVGNGVREHVVRHLRAQLRRMSLDLDAAGKAVGCFGKATEPPGIPNLATHVPWGRRGFGRVVPVAPPHGLIHHW